MKRRPIRVSNIVDIKQITGRNLYQLRKVSTTFISAVQSVLVAVAIWRVRWLSNTALRIAILVDRTYLLNIEDKRWALYTMVISLHQEKHMLTAILWYKNIIIRIANHFLANPDNIITTKSSEVRITVWQRRWKRYLYFNFDSSLGFHQVKCY